MITYSDIKELEIAFKNKKSIKVIKNTIYIFTGIIVLYIIIGSI